MSTTSAKPKRSHDRAQQQGLTRIGVHISVLKTTQLTADRILNQTGKLLRPSELLDWLAYAGDPLEEIGMCVTQHIPYEVCITVRPVHNVPFVSVVNGAKQPSEGQSAATPSSPLPANKARKLKKKNIADSEPLLGLE